MNNPEATIENIIAVGICYLAKKEGRQYVLRHESFEFIMQFVAVHRADAENIIDWLNFNKPIPKNDTAYSIFIAMNNPAPQTFGDYLYNNFTRLNTNLTEEQKNTLRALINEIAYLDGDVWQSYRSN